MIKIPLTQGKIAFVDDCDKHLSKYKWHFHPAGNGYAERHYCLPNYGKHLRVSLHHAIIGFPLNDLEIDHIDGNSLNNIRSNLRIVTHRENTQNCKCHRNNTKTSKYIGVHWDKFRKKWLSQIQIKGKHKFIGRFKTEEKANIAYQKAVDKLNK